MDEAALWAARARAEGPLPVAPGMAAPDGFRRLLESAAPRATGAAAATDVAGGRDASAVEPASAAEGRDAGPGHGTDAGEGGPGYRAWLVAVGPDGVTPAALRDLRLGLPALDHRNEASRVLAVCLRCCWVDLSVEPWPGRETTVDAVLAVLVELLPTRLPQTHHRFAVEALRQLTESGWLRWSERAGTVRLGPRVATWPVSDLETLRELCRTMPAAPSSPEAGQPVSPGPTVVTGMASGEENR
ncbi:hypothetical protein [Cryptosporangium sp. NPDC048952]|uniref:hypothetical protein n=1 Tax=Cryptosporangium sp. NPDC048952 TaxID=3363961 RepID=UPI0037109081